jgi:CHAT domain-containing protein/tetratricopeptide (TPR) repeat protein
MEMPSKASQSNSEGDPEKALTFAQSALQLFRSGHSNAGAIRAQEEITHSFFRQWNAKDCISSAVRQSKEAQLYSYRWIFVQGLLWQATCRAANGQLESARALANQALESSGDADYEGQRLQALLYSSGFLRSPEGEWRDIRSGLEDYWDSAHDPMHAFDGFTELAILAEGHEEYRLARDLRREALDAIGQTGDISFQAEAHYRLGMAARMAGDLVLSGAELKIGLDKFRALPPTAANKYYLLVATIDLAALDLQQNDLDAAQELVSSSPIAGTAITDSLNALNYNQIAGELYLRRGDLPKAEVALLKAVSIAEARLSTLWSESGRLDWEADANRGYRDLVELSLRQGFSVRALDEWEAFRGAPLRATHTDPTGGRQFVDGNYSTVHFSVPSVSAELPMLQHETILSYAILSNGLASWAFDERGIHFAWTNLRPDQLKHQIGDFEALCTDPDSRLEELVSEAESLYRVLIAPLEPFLDASRLLVVEPDTFFEGFPWSALVDSRGSYFIDRFALTVSPGLSYFRRLKARPQFHATDHALIAFTSSIRNLDTSKFQPLPDVAVEGESVARYFTNPDILSGTQLTSKEIQNHIPGAVVFHFAGHANAEPGKSGLLVEAANPSTRQISGTSLFSPRDAERSDLNSVGLVVLSACATAKNERGLRDPNSFVRIFLRAGVPHVVASQWAADSHTTAGLMDAFYGNLMTGKTVPRALQAAICLVKNSVPRAHPYYWAVFSAYGN